SHVRTLFVSTLKIRVEADRRHVLCTRHEARQLAAGCATNPILKSWSSRPPLADLREFVALSSGASSTRGPPLPGHRERLSSGIGLSRLVVFGRSVFPDDAAIGMS